MEIIEGKTLVDLLNDKLTLEERGLMFTIIMMRDKDPVLTEAKVKAKFSTIKYRHVYMRLHEAKLIKWSGYEKSRKIINKKTNVDPKVVEIMKFMNNLYGRNFKLDQVGVRARLDEHYDIEEIKLVIANRYEEWKDNEVMQVHLNPGTIFRPSKFEKYYEEATRTRVGESIVSAEKMNIKNGDVITLKMAQQFLDDSVYKIKTFRLDYNGSRAGIGMIGNRYGKDIKKSMKIQANTIKSGGQLEYEYVYLTK
jgi:uncharacterized phage protein (TIGR02220 family)